MVNWLNGVLVLPFTLHSFQFLVQRSKLDVGCSTFNFFTLRGSRFRPVILFQCSAFNFQCSWRLISAI